MSTTRSTWIALLLLVAGYPARIEAASCYSICSDLVWTQLADVISVAGVGDGVEGAVAGIIGSSIYVSHGYSFGDSAQLRIYDIPTNSWRLGPPGTVLRSEGGGEVYNGRLYSVGGRPTIASVEIYDPSAGAWSTGAPMPAGRKGMGFGIIGGLLHVVGGSDGSGPASGLPSAAHEVYDFAADSWSSRAPLPMPTADVTATVAMGTKLYVFGGWDGAAARDTTYIYDSVADRWSLGAVMPTARYAAAAAVLAGRAVVIGGLALGLGNLDVVEIYDAATDTWCTGPPKPRASSETGVGAIATADTIYVIGSGAFGISDIMHESLTLRACVLAVLWDSFEASRSAGPGGGVEVSFRTLAERDTSFFAVERAPAEAGPYAPVGDPVDARGAGFPYRLTDPGAPDRSWYRVVEHTSAGRGDSTPAFRTEAGRGTGPGRDLPRPSAAGARDRHGR